MNRPQMQRTLAQRAAEVSQAQARVNEQRKEIKRLSAKVEAVKAIQLPEPANDAEAQLVADMAQRIMRALES